MFQERKGKLGGFICNSYVIHRYQRERERESKKTYNWNPYELSASQGTRTDAAPALVSRSSASGS